MPRGRSLSSGDLFFILTPKNEAAKDVMRANSEHIVSHAGTYSIGCFLDRGSKYPGRLLSFGRNSVHDIVLPDAAPSGSRSSRAAVKATCGRTYQNYRNDHFFFFLAPSGELILRDLTPRLTQIHLENSSVAESALYGLRGNNPRQRVIPRTHRPLLLDFGTSTHFKFQWVGAYQWDDQIQPQLEARGLALHVSGLTLTAPESSLRPTPEHQCRELRSQYTPSRGSSLPGAHKRCIHKYRSLGQGTFGEVSKAVDLADGSLWAVKEIVSGQSNDTWRTSFVQEAEMLLDLEHDHIVHFETYQDFNIGGDYQLFFRLYKGSISELLRASRHSCESPPPEFSSPELWERLVTQMSSAVEYIHKKGVVHRDIKPDNIMYDHSRGRAGFDFFLSDFGLSMTEAAINGRGPGGGTHFFNAPELANTRTPTPASDIWALGVTFGVVCGYWCYSESARSASFWARKLTAFGRPAGTYADPPVARERDVWPHRVAALALSPLFPPAMSWMLSSTPAERPSASQLTLARIGDFTPVMPAGQSANSSRNTQQRTQPQGIDSRTTPPPYPGTPSRGLQPPPMGMAPGPRPGMQDRQMLPPPVSMSRLQAHPNPGAQLQQQGPQPAARQPVAPQSGRPQPPRPAGQMPPPQQQQQQRRQSPWERDPNRPLLPVAGTLGRPQLPPLRDPPAGQAPPSHLSGKNSVPRSLLMEHSVPWPRGWQEHEQSLPPRFSYQGDGAASVARGVFNGRSV